MVSPKTVKAIVNVYRAVAWVDGHIPSWIGTGHYPEPVHYEDPATGNVYLAISKPMERNCRKQGYRLIPVVNTWDK